ncbi:nucleoside hydrolase-like isoform X2 [Bacillus rossius redtenbacheri]|uniref:nucleoside hydrolase-like isoform X2 n=1 Tax=Bacillus rossius redtenbacheri TaxID=93214 RepID=UPI002FDEBF4E
MACPRPPRLVVDVDVGSDDAMGLMVVAAAERKGSARLLGVTCVHGNTDLDHVCANALKTLHTIGRLDVPVYRGAHASLVDTMKRAEDIHGGDGFGDFEYEGAPDVETHLQKEHAVLYLTRVVRETPGSITLLCLGPLTNIALAIRMDKDFCTNVKEIIIMGGNVEGIGNVTAAAEFNFHCDPEAAYITVHNMKCPVTILPWETAFNHCALPYEWRINTLGSLDSPQSRLMSKVEAPMLTTLRYGRWARCDPIAAAIAVDPSVAVEEARLHATVELHGTATRGAFVVDHLDKLGLQPNVTIVKRVDVELYKKIMIDAFSGDLSRKIK